MRMFPIIPIWIMFIICLLLIIYIIKKNNKNIIQIIMVILIFIINLRIMIPSDNSMVMSNNLDVIFAIDNSISMNAEDYNGNNTRLYAVKRDCNYIVNRLNGARFSVITFNHKATIVTPFTKDNNMTVESIDVIQPINNTIARGSSLNSSHDLLLKSLQSSEKKDNKTRIVFFISDGEITDESTLNSFKDISKHIKNGAVLGYGTKQGGRMKSKSSYSETSEYLKDTSDYPYKDAISKIDENNLKQIAKDMNINYIHMDKQGRINNKLREINRLVNTSISSNDKSSYDDIYFIFVIPLLILLIIELGNYRRNII